MLAARVELLEQEADAREAEQEWAAVDEELVTRGYAAPYGVATAGVLASGRLDMERCARFHPVCRDGLLERLPALSGIGRNG